VGFKWDDTRKFLVADCSASNPTSLYENKAEFFVDIENAGVTNPLGGVAFKLVL